MSDSERIELARRAANGDAAAALALLRSLERGSPQPSGLGQFVPEPYLTGPGNPQTLTNAKIGAVPSQSGRTFDQLNSGPAPAGIRQEAHWEARQLVQDDPTAIMFAERVAMGVREALATCGALAFEPNLIVGNVRAEQVELFRRAVIVPPNPTADQLAWATAMVKANQSPVTFSTAGADTFPNFVQINGAGEVAGFDVNAGWVGIVDEIGVTSFSLQAEYELVWALGMGFAQTTSTATQNAAQMMIPPQRGWPIGSVATPGKLNGRSRIAPTNGSALNTTRISFRVQHAGTSSPVQSTPHYVEVKLRGWKLQIGRNNRPISVGVGGSNCGGPGCS